MKNTHYHEHENKRYKLSKLEKETTLPRPDKYFCEECGVVYAESFGSGASVGPTLVLVGYVPKHNGGSSG